MADKKKILIADSTQGIAENYRHLLSADYDVEVVHSGKEAARRLERGVDGLDLIVLESIMDPGPRGSEIARYIRKTNPSFPVVVTTASPEQYPTLVKVNIPVYGKDPMNGLMDYIRRTLGY